MSHLDWGMTDGAVRLDDKQLGMFMPLHLVLAPDGRITGAGATMRKMLPEQPNGFEALFLLTRPSPGEDALAALRGAAQNHQRVFMRMRQAPYLTLRGHVAALDDGRLLINAGFGIGLPEAVRALSLTDGDFAPSELAMELLFLHEANQSVMHELSRFNLRLEEAREAAELQAFTDPLTGLFNRRGLDLALAVVLSGGKTPDRTDGFALAHLDLDLFKQVNDRLGHAAGDAVLQRVARVLRDETRGDDTIARVGGDEFVLLLPGMTSEDALWALARRIISGIEKPVILGAESCLVSASIGITRSLVYDTPDAERMQADADAALYCAKREGRGRAMLYDPAAPPTTADTVPVA